MLKDLTKIAKDTNSFLKTFIKTQKKNRTNYTNVIRFILWR